MNHKNLTTSIFVLLVIIALTLGCTQINKLIGNQGSIPFDANGWKNGNAVERGRMSWRMIGAGTFRESVGQNKTEVIQRLGEPDKIREDKVGDQTVTVLMYEIDLDDPMFISALQVFIGEDDSVLFANHSVLGERKSLIEKLKPN